jgi:hypothetical protein
MSALRGDLVEHEPSLRVERHRLLLSIRPEPDASSDAAFAEHLIAFLIRPRIRCALSEGESTCAFASLRRSRSSLASRSARDRDRRARAAPRKVFGPSLRRADAATVPAAASHAARTTSCAAGTGSRSTRAVSTTRRSRPARTASSASTSVRAAASRAMAIVHIAMFEAVKRDRAAATRAIWALPSRARRHVGPRGGRAGGTHTLAAL